MCPWGCHTVQTQTQAGSLSDLRSCLLLTVYTLLPVHLSCRIWRTSSLISTRMALQISRFGDRWTKTSSSRPSWTPSCWTTQRQQASSLRGPLSAVSPCSRTHSWPSPTSTCSLRERGTAVRGKPRLWMNRWMRTRAGRAGWWPTTRTRCSGTLLTSGRGRGCWASTLHSRSCAVTYRRFPTRSGCRRSTHCGWPSRTSPCWERSSCRAATPNHTWTSAWRTATRTKPTRSGTQVVSWSLSSVVVESDQSLTGTSSLRLYFNIMDQIEKSCNNSWINQQIFQ